MMTLQNVPKAGERPEDIYHYRLRDGSLFDMPARTCKDVSDLHGEELLKAFAFLSCIAHNADEPPAKVELPKEVAEAVREEAAANGVDVLDAPVIPLPGEDEPDFVAALAAQDPVLCSVCGGKFKNVTGRKLHMARMHEGEAGKPADPVNQPEGAEGV